MSPERKHPAAMARALLALAAAGLLLGGCMSSRLEEFKHAATGIAEGESIVILARSYHKGKAVEEKLVDCINRRVQSGADRLRVAPQQEFVDALFPWLEPRMAPQSAEALPALLARPGVAERIEARGVRYIVWVDGNTEKSSGGGSMGCAIGPGGGGCLGVTWWEDDASYKATIWDLQQQSDAGSVSAEVHGTSVIPALIIPLPLIARTQSAACSDMAGQLRHFITGTDS